MRASMYYRDGLGKEAKHVKTLNPNDNSCFKIAGGSQYT